MIRKNISERSRTQRRMRLAFATQTNTTLPVLAYLLETETSDCADVVLVNSQHLTHPESRSASEHSIIRLITAVAPKVHCEVFISDLPLHLVRDVSLVQKIKQVRVFKNNLRLKIKELKQKFNISSNTSVGWVSDVGIRNFTLFGYAVSPGELVFVPHEMRHFNKYASLSHQTYWGAPGPPGAIYRRLARMSKWLAYGAVGCRQPSLFWPLLKAYKHVSYNDGLAWHPRSQIMKGVHDRVWYERRMLGVVATYVSDPRERALIVLSQVHDNLETVVQQIQSALQRLAHRKITEIHVKMHPQEIGLWKECCRLLEKHTNLSVFRDEKINCYPSELWLAAVEYGLVLGFSSGGMIVARDVYRMETITIS